MGWDIAGVALAIIGGVITVAMYFIKKKQDKKEDQDALATVEAEELEAGLDRVDALDRERVRQQADKAGPS